MAGIFQRMSLIFRAKTDKALDKLEDPRQTLDYSYQRQLELLQKVRRGVADVATSRKRVELQANGLNTQADKLTQQAQKALEVGREDLAREALTRRSGLQQQLTDLQAQHAQLQGEEEKLTRASQRLQAKVDAFRTRKETIKATYSAAEAQTRINEAFSGISEEMGDVGLAIQRAEDKTAQMQARAGAIDELLASGRPGRPDRDGQGRHHPRAGAAGVDLRRGERAEPDEGLARRRAGGCAAGHRGCRAAAGAPQPAPNQAYAPPATGAAHGSAEPSQRGTCDDRPHPERGSVADRRATPLTSSTPWTTRSSRRRGRRPGAARRGAAASCSTRSGPRARRCRTRSCGLRPDPAGRRRLAGRGPRPAQRVRRGPHPQLSPSRVDRPPAASALSVARCQDRSDDSCRHRPRLLVGRRGPRLGPVREPARDRRRATRWSRVGSGSAGSSATSRSTATTRATGTSPWSAWWPTTKPPSAGGASQWVRRSRSGSPSSPSTRGGHRHDR